MKSAFLCLALLVGLGLSTSTISAQDTLSYEAHFAEVLDLVYANANLDEAEKRWILKMLKTTCECEALGRNEKGRDCMEAFMKEEDLPLTEEAFANITPEQNRKLMLMAPLISMGLKCPE